MRKFSRTRLTITVSIAAAVVLMLLVTSCGVSGDRQRTEAPMAASFDAQAEVDFEAGEMLADEAPADGALAMTSGAAANAPAEVPNQQQRIILRDANLQITVEDTEATIGNISTMANDMGGWVVTANSSTTIRGSDGAEITNGSVTVRVPAERLDEALTTIRDGAVSVDGETVNGRDVTEEYVDLSSRLSNLEATEEQLVEILETAYTVEDVLAVQRELTTVRGQIEQIQGRLRFFDEAAAFSSVSVTVREQVPSVGNVEVAGWSPLQTAQNAFGSLIVVGQFLADSVINLAILGVPALAVLVAVVWTARRVMRRLRGRNTVTPATGD